MNFNFKEKLTKQLINRYGSLRIIQAAIFTIALNLTAVTILEFCIPVKVNDPNLELAENSNFLNTQLFSRLLENNKPASNGLDIPLRDNLFKPDTAIRDKPAADKTIERIKAQLHLQCIMKIQNRPVVYIDVKGLGLKKLAVGDSVNDLFKVININENSVEISIVEHKLLLRL